MLAPQPRVSVQRPRAPDRAQVPRHRGPQSAPRALVVRAAHVRVITPSLLRRVCRVPVLDLMVNVQVAHVRLQVLADPARVPRQVHVPVVPAALAQVAATVRRRA